MVIKMMRELMEKGFIKAMIFITHELPLLYNVTDDIMVMYAGQIIERGTAHQMVFDPVHPYSKGLMGSIIVPEEGTRDVKLEAIPGTPPNLKKPPPGCRFAARCKYVIPSCMHGERSERIFDGTRMHRCIHSVEYLQGIYAKERDPEKQFRKPEPKPDVKDPYSKFMKKKAEQDAVSEPEAAAAKPEAIEPEPNSKKAEV